MNSCTLESALRILIAHRNLRSLCRPAVRQLIRDDIRDLRLLRAGLPSVHYLED